MTREDVPIDTERVQLEYLKENTRQTRQTNELCKKTRWQGRACLQVA